MKKMHVLKIWPEMFEAVKSESKTFELRKNDRDFKVGDVLMLCEFNPVLNCYTGKIMAHRVTYILQGEFGLPPELCVMSIHPLKSLSWG